MPTEKPEKRTADYWRTRAKRLRERAEDSWQARSALLTAAKSCEALAKSVAALARSKVLADRREPPEE